jgi:hypothetical protein
MIIPQSSGNPIPSGNGQPADKPGSTLQTALGYLQSGLSVIPIRRDGSKAPTEKWKPYEQRRATEAEARYWWGGSAPPGIANVYGAVSGNAELLDFDLEAETIYPAWCRLVETECPGLPARLCEIGTPDAGYHLVYRCPTAVIPGNDKLAGDPSKQPPPGSSHKEYVMIETRGEGGYALAPGSPACCHETGRLYVHQGGPPLTALSVVTAAEREVMIRCARSFDREPVEEPAPFAGTGGGESLRPGDDYCARGPGWKEILEPHGWRLVRQAEGKDYWRRPGKDGHGWSATTGLKSKGNGWELLCVFSSNAAPFNGPCGGKPCSTYTKFGAYAFLNHGGNFGKAARALAAGGYGGQDHHGNGKTAGPVPEPWPQPVPLTAIPEVPPFPIDVFPEVLQVAVGEVAAALQCPADYAGVPLLCVAGGALGASRALAVKGSHVQRAVLYEAVVGPPGSAKTPALEIVCAPLDDHEAALHAKWLAAMEQYDLDLEVYEHDKKKWLKDREGDRPEKPERPVQTRAMVDDVTVESLAPILMENPRGVVLPKDELLGWVLAMNQYREGGRGADQQFWLSNWSSKTFVVDRKKERDKGPLRVPHPFVGVVGGLVPAGLRKVRGDRGRQQGTGQQDGFLDRLLWSYPDEVPEGEENWAVVSSETTQDLKDVLDKLRTLKMEPVQTEDGTVTGHRPYVVKLTASGRKAWRDFTRGHAAERNADDFPEHLKGPWAKLRGYCARLALIVHYLRWACGEVKGDQSDVDGDSVKRAARLVAYFKGHARKVYAVMDADPKTTVAGRLLRRLERAKRRRFTRREAYRAMRGTVGKIDDIDAVLDLLEKHGYIRPLPDPGTHRGPGRRPSPAFEVHPSLSLGQNGHNGHNSSPEGDETTHFSRNGDRDPNSVHCVHSVHDQDGGAQDAEDLDEREAIRLEGTGQL